MNDLICQTVTDPKQLHIDLLAKVDHECGTAVIVEQIRQKHIVLYEVCRAEKVIGIFCNLVEKLWDGRRELVHLYTVTNDKAEPYFGKIANYFEEQLAKRENCRSIRLHTNTDAAGRYMEKKLGFEKIETVYRRWL